MGCCAHTTPPTTRAVSTATPRESLKSVISPFILASFPSEGTRVLLCTLWAARPPSSRPLAPTHGEDAPGTTKRLSRNFPTSNDSHSSGSGWRLHFRAGILFPTQRSHANERSVNAALAPKSV